MTSNVFGLIYTEGSNVQLKDLTFQRSIAAVPFGGRYRCIDFALSNMVNSRINNVGIIMQKNYDSLIDHMGSGKEWDLNRKRDGLFILPPSSARDNSAYEGTVDAIGAVMGYIRRSQQKYVLLTGSHTIYNTTYDNMVACHKDTGADITVMYNVDTSRESAEQPYDDLRLILDETTGRIRDLMINPYRPETGCRSCDTFIMEKALLEHLIAEAQAHALHDFTRDILIRKMNTLRLFGYKYDGFVARLDSLSEFYRNNMALLSREVMDDLFCPGHPIYTKVKDEVPAKYGSEACVKNSMIADGCLIEGCVENSLLFRGVSVGRGVVIKNSIIMQGAEIMDNAELDCVILDKGVTVKRGRRLSGYGNFPVIIRKNSVV